jgi:3'(2'), 5'-bisphosphate nucleotidase
VSELDAIVRLAEDAGRAILEVYNSGANASEFTRKGDNSPLTLADRRSHDVIVHGLAIISPDIMVVSEEDASLSALADEAWVVDPLDGTKEFIKRTDEFTVNIALVRRGVPVAGVVHAPALQKTWVGSEAGAFRREGGAIRDIQVTASPDANALRLVASKDHAGPAVRALLDRLPGAQTLSMGSSLKFCLVAEGNADLYLRDGPTMEWDTAAAHAVLRAAGGDVYTLDGAPLRYGKSELRNPHFVAAGSPTLDWRALLAP